MLYTITTALRKLLGLKKRIKIVQGGSSASKTISILQIFIDRCQRDTEPKLRSVVSESLPHLKRGAIQDFLQIMEGHQYFQDARWNKSDFTYTFETGSRLEFFSVDQAEKVKGARRDDLFINEANNVKEETYNQLEIRTKGEIWVDFNPTNEFWALTNLVGKRDDVDHIILTYLDNEGLPDTIRHSLEVRKNNKNWWQVYGLGQLGEVEGKIYRDWQIIDSIPHEARLERRGLDFGYSNDPTAIIEIYKYNGGYILDELTYQKGLSNKQIADILSDKKEILVKADSAEPKSIDEIRSYGINILPASKGKGSVNQGIQFVQDQRISITKRSINLIREYRNYLWQTDKEGKIINVPDVGFDHCMDAIRYGLSDYMDMGNIRIEYPEDNYQPTSPYEGQLR